MEQQNSPEIIFNIRFTDSMRNTKERSFYCGTSKYSFFNYVQGDTKICKRFTRYEDYMNKCGTGLFNRHGPISEEELQHIRKALVTTESLIWHGFISFNDEMSDKFQSQEDCVNFLRHNFNVIFEKSKINADNIELVAGLHNDTEHKHIHFMFFEKKPKTINSKGVIDYTRKGSLHMAAVEKFLINGNLWLEGYEDEVYGVRDALLKELKKIIPSARKSQEEKTQYIKRSFSELSNMLPTKGRLGYNSNNISIAVRNKVDSIVSALINANPNLLALEKKYAIELKNREKAIQAIAKDNHLIYSNSVLNPSEIRQVVVLGRERKYDELTRILYKPEVIERLIQDKKGRLGNLIIHVALEMRNDNNKCRKLISDSYGGKYIKINAKKKRDHCTQLTSAAITRFAKIYSGIKTDFTHDLERVEKQIEFENYKNRG